MEKNHRRTKIVATIGPATSSPQILRSLITTGMDVARLNFSHGSHEDHAQRIQTLRAVSDELHTPITILQDLQGPKIRVGELPGGEVKIEREQIVELVPQESFRGEPGTIPIDYSTAAAERKRACRSSWRTELSNCK
jgi:pyruvate kinase